MEIDNKKKQWHIKVDSKTGKAKLVLHRDDEHIMPEIPIEVLSKTGLWENLWNKFKSWFK